MNATETKAFNYLAKRYNAEDIKFHTSSSPDFTIGFIGYEVKRLYGNKVLFFNRQWYYLSQHFCCYLLLFRDGGEEPEAIIPMSDVPIGLKRYGEYTFQITDTMGGKSLSREEYLKQANIPYSRRKGGESIASFYRKQKAKVS